MFDGMMHARRIEDLTRRLREPLPGDAAKAALAPRPARGRLGRPPDPGARDAAVLVLLVQGAERLHMPLMVRRSITGDVHSGQIALPGGGVEHGESIEDAALREAHEELAIDPASVEILGRLSPQWIPVSNYVVWPVVGVSGRRPDLRPDPSEVARAFWSSPDVLPLDDVTVRTREREGVAMEMPGWELPEGFLWGATAMILAELVELLGPAPSTRQR